jgi:hypothetical protein
MTETKHTPTPWQCLSSEPATSQKLCRAAIRLSEARDHTVAAWKLAQASGSDDVSAEIHAAIVHLQAAMKKILCFDAGNDNPPGVTG